jgi:hypothetical protein
MSVKDAVIGTFDRVIIFATLGIPSHYHCVKYCIEYVMQSEKKVTCDNMCRHISTVALRDFIAKALQENGKQLGSLSTLVFFLDTVLLDLDINIARESKECVQKSRRELFICILKNIVLKAKQRRDTGSLVQELSLLGIPEECEQVDDEAVRKCLKAVNERYIAFVPGVITKASRGKLVTFRIDEAYPVVVGTIATYALARLIHTASANDESLAIVVDTTHGMNYFALALKDAVQLTAELYAYTMLLKSKPRKIVIYHYNSDPVDVRREETLSAALSVKLHLLNEIPVAVPTDSVHGFRIVPRHVPLLVEQAVNSVQDINALVKWLATRSGNLLKYSHNSVEDAWRKVVYSALLFSRNLFLWALRQAYDISSRCTSTGDLANDLIGRIKAIVSNVISVVEEMEIAWRTEKRALSVTEHKVSYSISGNAPDVLAVTLLILGEVLKSYTMYTSASAKDIYNVIAGAQSHCVEDQDKEALSFVQSLKLDEKGELIRDSSNNAYICFEMDKVLNIARKLYHPQDLAILEHELRDVRGSRRKTRAMSIVKLCNNAHVVISHSERVSKISQRNVYAHAGLAGGLPWFAVVKPSTGMAVVCLGDPQKVINIVLSSAS